MAATKRERPKTLDADARKLNETYELFGEQVTLRTLAEMAGCSPAMLAARLRAGLSVADAVGLEGQIAESQKRKK